MTDQDHAHEIREAAMKLNEAIHAAFSSGLSVDVELQSLEVMTGRHATTVHPVVLKQL